MLLKIATRWLALIALIAASSAVRAEPGEPRLVVTIVVDQMRADYLDRYDAYFEGGFRRLLDHGVVFENTWVDHAHTNSLPGHTTAITGTYPRTHGITDNMWHSPAQGKDVVASGFSLIDRTDGAPYALGALTFAEHVLRANPEARFASIGANNAAKIYAGQLRGQVFWFDDEVGFTTNQNYAAETPRWVNQFNADAKEKFLKAEWGSSLPVSLVKQLRPDNSPFENRGFDVSFPHVRAEDVEVFAWLAKTPMRDELTLQLALQSLDEGLGQNSTTDVLSISLTSLDEIGHAFGPFSHEQTDALLRLDKALGKFMDGLDERLGPDGWVLALTADHGVATTPEQRKLWGSAEGVRISRDQAVELADAAYAAYASESDIGEARLAAARAIEDFDFVRKVYSEEQVAKFQPDPATIEGLLALSYVPGRIPAHPFYIREKALAELGLFIILHEDVMMDWGTAIHGSQYDYDRRVPMVFLGRGIAPSRISGRVATTDMVPTLLKLLKVQPAQPLDGISLVANLQRQ